MNIEQLQKHTEEAMKVIGCPRVTDRLDAFYEGMIAMSRYLAIQLQRDLGQAKQEEPIRFPSKVKGEEKEEKSG